jgi:alkylation response protein AidB-like acyl-CoA dehydrogenase
MNFDTPGEKAFRAEIRHFIATRVPAAIRDAVRAGRQVTREQRVEWQRILNRKGWAAPRWPAEHGGTGWTPVQRLIFLEELHLGYAPEPLPFNVTMLGPVLINYGTAQQKTRFLDRARNLDDWWCQGFSEPGSGSDLASLRTSARRQGDRFVVSGQKIWTTLGHYADWMFCLVRTDASQKKQRGISFLLIDMRSRGVEVRPIVTIDGLHEVNEVFLDEVEVPVENLVGNENEGWTIAKFLLSYERTGIARAGLTKVILSQVHASLARCAPGKAEALRRKLALLEVELLALDATQHRLLARSAASDGAVDPMSSILKLMGSEVRQRASELLLEACGERALVAARASVCESSRHEEALERAAESYFGLRAASIYGGTSEIQKNIIAQAVLHLA